MTMSGQKTLTANERLIKFEEAVSNYIESKGLNPIGFSHEAIEVLNLDSSTLRTMTSEECISKSYIVYAYANYLQEEYNQNMVKLNFAMDNIRCIVANEISQFDKYTKHEIKQQQIISNNPFATKLETIRKHAQARIDRLSDKIRDIRKMGDSLLELGKRKAYS